MSCRLLPMFRTALFQRFLVFWSFFGLMGCDPSTGLEPPAAFEKIISLTGEQEIRGIIGLEDELLILGTTRLGGEPRLLLLCTDLNGEVRWQSELENGTEGQGIAIGLDGNISVVGTVHQESGDRDMLYARFDRNGQLLSQRNYGGPLNDIGRDVEPLGVQGRTLLLGTTQSFGNGSADMYAVCIGPDGEEVWSRTFGGAALDGGSEIERIDPFVPVLLGFTESFGSGGRDLYIQTVSLEGDSLAAFTFGSADYEESQSFARISGGGLVMCNHTAGTDPAHNLWAMVLDGNLQVQWEKEFGASGTHDGGEGVSTDNAGSFFFLGRTNSFGSDEQMYFIQTDEDGNVLKEEAIGGQGDQQGHDLIIHKGSCYMVGTSTEQGAANVFLVKRPV